MTDNRAQVYDLGALTSEAFDDLERSARVAQHVADFPKFPPDSQLRHLIEHGQNADLINTLSADELALLHGSWHDMHPLSGEGKEPPTMTAPPITGDYEHEDDVSFVVEPYDDRLVLLTVDVNGRAYPIELKLPAAKALTDALDRAIWKDDEHAAELLGVTVDELLALRERDALNYPHDEPCPACGRRQWTDEHAQETCQACGIVWGDQ